MDADRPEVGAERGLELAAQRAGQAAAAAGLRTRQAIGAGDLARRPGAGPQPSVAALARGAVPSLPHGPAIARPAPRLQARWRKLRCLPPVATASTSPSAAAGAPPGRVYRVDPALKKPIRWRVAMTPPPPPPSGPEAQARVEIDAAFEAAGWVVQNRDQMNLSAALGVAVREFKLKAKHGYADYLLFVDGKAVGVFEAKEAGHTLTGVEPQSEKYAAGLPDGLNPPITPLPFLYLGTGAETKFTNLLDPAPRSRRLFHVHRPETLAEWLEAPTLNAWVESNGAYTAADDTRPSTLRARLRAMPGLEPAGLYPNQVQAITNLEQSLWHDKPRALLQMATGSGKTLTSVAEIYRLIKFGGARRVLFLVDRSNLGEQAEKEFQNFETPDDHRKFTELYVVQRLASNTIDAAAKVVITTIQRLFSMLKGEEVFEEPEGDETQLDADGFGKEPIPVAFNPGIPPEYFDVIFIDECHRSIYSLWRQVLEYFDAYLIGLTATPAKHTFGFFNKNLVMEYGHEQAVVDGVNVDFEIYKVRTKITEGGATIDVEDGTMLGLRDRRTRKVRWETPDDAVTYTAGDLDRNVVARDQIRLIVRTFRDRVLKETFGNRTEVPKTLIFAKDDSHAEDIVELVREEFGRGNDFCTKITYKTSGKKPKELIQDFRTGYNPRVVVTVDLIATGTDIRPIEIVMFMRSVKSRVLFEQMKGRGVRIIDPNELKAVTPDALAKTHFLIVDCVGVTEGELADTQPLERQKNVSMREILEHVSMGGTHPDALSSLASRLSRLDKRCGPDEIQQVVATGGTTLKAISHAIVDALDPDRQIIAARVAFKVPADQEPTEAQVKKAAETLIKAAVAPLATRPAFRQLVQDLKKQLDQIIDEVSLDELLVDKTGLSAEARDKARTLVVSFEHFLEEHKDEIAALQFFYSVPHKNRLHYGDIQALARAITAPPRSWTPERLWRAYELLDKDKVRGASVKRLLTDIVSLVRFALHQDGELTPHAERVKERFENWMAQQANGGRTFTAEQAAWLEMMRDHVAASWEIEIDDFDSVPFVQAGGVAKAMQVFGKELPVLIQQINEAVAA
jgi:type I restriction enzyme R subunit